MRRNALIFSCFAVATVALLCLDVARGNVGLSLGEVWGGITGSADATTVKIVRQVRMVKALTALLAGAALSVSGLQMQTLFRNPLAGPYVLGISSGASLGVALLLLTGVATSSAFGLAAAAWIGAGVTLALIVALSAKVKDVIVILILGIMLSSGIGAVVQILQYLSREEALKSFVVWTMGSLGDVTSPQLLILAVATGIGLLAAWMAVKPLDLMLMGEQYARTMGLDLRRSRTLILFSTTILAGGVTAFCGPIGFIGLAMPHVARALMRTASHRVLLPASALIGAAVLVMCDLIAKTAILPINAVTALLGIPVVVWVVLRTNRIYAA